MNIAFCAAEAFPYAKTGGLADVCGALPLALEKIGLKVHIFLPKYKWINDSQYTIERVSQDFSKTKLGSSWVYLIEHDNYFNRDGIYGDEFGDFTDNLERFSYFSLKILEVLKQLDLKVDIVHCHDWHTALVPVYLKERFKDDLFF